MVPIRGIRYVLVPWWAERGKDLAADRAGAIKEAVLTTAVDAAMRRSIV